MATTNLNAMLDGVLSVKPKAKMNGLPVQVHATKAAHHIKAVRIASRLARLMQATPTSAVEEAIAGHKEILSDLGFHVPKSLKECNTLLAKLGE